MGQFARETQIMNLAGRVVRHVYDPAADPEFNQQERIQLERALDSYLPLLASNAYVIW